MNENLFLAFLVGKSQHVYNNFVVVVCFFTDPAEITFVSINQTVQMGKNASLYCRADGNPTPSISWTRDHNVGSGSVLHFDSTRLSDNGWYKCTAQNGIGSPATVRVYLDVVGK